ncbi:MAG: Filamentation induced by cAMP protein Fic [Clostridiales bacterium 38_11]|nr:MAG: Filamentation induced by cAMP protein Fic [Clostridiales bacterium 38_11]
MLQEVRISNNWEKWIAYILTGIEETAIEALGLVKRINFIPKSTILKRVYL